MTDEQLLKYVGLDASSVEATRFLSSLTPEYRASYERMAEVEIEIALWQEGLGPKPTGVLIDMDRKRERSL